MIRSLIPRIERLNAGRHWSWLTLSLVDDTGISRVHDAYFGDNRITDVVSCAYPPLPGVTDGWLGDLHVNVQRAVEEGASRPRGVAGELALYLAHGLDHLSGARDDTDTLRRRMLRREYNWIRGFPVEELIVDQEILKYGHKNKKLTDSSTKT